MKKAVFHAKLLQFSDTQSHWVWLLFTSSCVYKAQRWQNENKKV